MNNPFGMQVATEIVADDFSAAVEGGYDADQQLWIGRPEVTAGTNDWTCCKPDAPFSWWNRMFDVGPPC